MLNPNNAPEPRFKSLYQEVILDHNRNPRNFKAIENPTQYSHGVNPLCGDDYHLYLVIDDNQTIQDVGFQGNGCAISKASASMMTTFLKEKKVDEVSSLKDAFLEMMTNDQVKDDTKSKIGRLAMFEGVREFPVRVKCATLIWQALQDALQDTSSPQ